MSTFLFGNDAVKNKSGKRPPKQQGGSEKVQTVKQYLLQWADNYQKKYGVRYRINWALEGKIVRTLISRLSHRDMVDVFNFAFTDNPANSFLRLKGHKLYYFFKEYDRILVEMKNPGHYIPDDDLQLGLEYWNDIRTEHLWRLILRSDLEQLKAFYKSEYLWDLLFAKILRYQGFIPEQVQYLYDMWKANETITRRAIKYGDRRKGRSRLS
jgi:hypothetical protein